MIKKLKRSVKAVVLESDGFVGMVLYTIFFIVKYGPKKGIAMGTDNKWFDWHYKTDTTTTRTDDPNYVVDLETDNVPHAVESTGDKVTRFRRGIKVIKAQGGFDPSRSTFIDYGCGKGRMLILAKKLGFDRVLGVELSSSMLALCRKNLAITKCEGVELVEEDATRFEPDLNNECVVFYFYNPFSEIVFNEVIEQIMNNCSSNNDNKRRYFLVYSNPVHQELFEDRSGCECLFASKTEKINVYRIDPNAITATSTFQAEQPVPA